MIKMVYQNIAGLIQKAIDVQLIEHSDHIYARNQVLSLLQLEAFPENSVKVTDDSIPNLLNKLVSFAINEGLIADVFDDKEILSAQIMDIFVARPSIINRIFSKKYKHSPIEATDYFYELSQHSNYIQMNRIEKNIHFKTETGYGELDITINLSKPEKDPEQIKREQELKGNVDYPKCPLCVENEGYVGRTGYPARANHRVITVPLFDETWYLQYSPYVYYNEHSILLSEEHRDMKIDKLAFKRLLAFTEKFPHYFIGSNADLPIVGGSILSHDHYQAGHYEFAMTTAKSVFSFDLEAFSNVNASVLKWPLSVIRLQSDNQNDLAEVANHILKTWKTYSDSSVHIEAFTGNTPHNTVTPIARRRGELYELDIVLRNNRTSKEHPMGIFHPHEDVQHIKKENIGLIEVMGLAVLPARLKNELAEIKKELLGQDGDVASYHQPWTTIMKEKYGTLSHEKETDRVIKNELGNKFTRVLEDAGVFKGNEAFKRFINVLNRSKQH